MNLSIGAALFVTSLMAGPSIAGAGEMTLGGSWIKLLHEAKEPAVIRNTNGTQHYRLIYRPIFSEPLIVRVTKTGDRIVLRSVLFTGARTGRITDTQTKVLSPREWERIESLAKAAKFWTMPSENDEMGTDGTNWALEGVRDGAYHVAFRWMPSAYAKERDLQHFVGLGRYLAKLSPHRLQIQ